MLKVKHYAFKEVPVKYPINWLLDPYKNKNWVLHFLSLRWTASLSFEDKVKVVEDFYNFHFVKKRQNAYIKTLRGDHAAAIRIKILIELAKKSSSEKVFELVNETISNEVQNLTQDSMYRVGHNHGLMLDNAILDIYFFNKEISGLDQNLVTKVVNRGILTSKKMYSYSGVTQEHSISYQEYNMPLVIEFYEKISKLDFISLGYNDVNYINIIKFSSLLILSAFLRSNNQFFAIGDTLRLTKPKILKEVFGHENAVETLSKNFTGIYCLGGFFSYKKDIANKRLNFVSTCQWNSFNHKQDDEFSFCLEYDGKLIFDDLGYSGFLTAEQQNIIYSCKGHSTFYFEDDAWLSRQNTPQGSRINSYELTRNGFFLSQSHQRSSLPVTFVREVELFDKLLKIEDSLVFSDESEMFSEKNVIHRFVLNPEINIVIDGCKVYLNGQNNKLIAIIEVITTHVSGKWVATTVPYVNVDSRSIVNSVAIDFHHSAVQRKVDFLIMILD
ncbi:heparinase II/III-family protein [Acinetobacter sp. NIPH 1869]|uniref:heparinase II/III domain-containing protein n=1 Tax=Acinetobacter higginsii TaxID=70347 RepID=UPI001F4A3B40|nr:heparinase II/III family protein [Acinetobacter higginsii]MCH7304938.1 heparinase II/III-family protein [Acinetobacter higginsii]